MNRHKRTARLLAAAEARINEAMWGVDDEFDDADAYGYRLNSPVEVIDEARRQWDCIPTDPAAIAIWMRDEPINGVKP